MATSPIRTYLALGSNLGDRRTNLEEMHALIADRIGEVVRCSSVIETAPEGFVSENSFLNQVLAVETSLSLEEIHCETQRIERELGRSQKTIGGCYHDRKADIDILFYGDTVQDSDELTVPHPRYRERLFVLEPLCEIAPELRDPRDGERVDKLTLDLLLRLKGSETSEA